MRVEDLREHALSNFELLLNHWKLDYKQITPAEYDIIARWRNDENFGGCRFNTTKARGADFAGGGLTQKQINNDLSVLGFNLDASDLIGSSELRIGFDIIGLCQRVYGLHNPGDAAKQLEKDLTDIAKLGPLAKPLMDAAERRRLELEADQERKFAAANDIWKTAKRAKFDGSPADKYLASRGIHVRDPNMGFHPRLSNSRAKKPCPTLVFKVSKLPGTSLAGIHRVFLTPEGKKEGGKDAKQALAHIKGNAIWLGQPGPKLWLAEGPESALYLREMGFPFVASCVYATNMHNLNIPPGVLVLTLVPDQDKSGEEACDRALAVYGKIPYIRVEQYPYIEGIKDVNDLYLRKHNV